MHVDAIGKHRKGFGIQAQFDLSFLSAAWPKERAGLKPFGHDPISSSVPIKYLDEIAPFVGKNKQGAAACLFFEFISDQSAQSIGSRSHIAGLQRHEDLQTAGEAQHVSLWRLCFATLG